MSRARVFIGDVHGCADELDELLDTFRYDPAAHELWFVGDLVNRGPASLRALERVRGLGAGTVLGNHDLHLLRLAAGKRERRPNDTMDDILESPDRDDHLEWIRTRPLVHAWDDLLLVHAGVHPRWTDPVTAAKPLEEKIAGGKVPRKDPDLHFFTKVRHCNARGEIPEDDLDPGRGFAPWDAHYRGGCLVVCGHWAARGLVRTDRVRGLDTACVWGGSLTAWNAEEDRFWSVPARRAYQQPGR